MLRQKMIAPHPRGEVGVVNDTVRKVGNAPHTGNRFYSARNRPGVRVECAVKPTLAGIGVSGMDLIRVEKVHEPRTRTVGRAPVTKGLDTALDHSDDVTLMRVRRKGVGDVVRVQVLNAVPEPELGPLGTLY